MTHFLEIFSLNDKLKENLLKKLLKNIIEIIKRLDESIKFIKSEIKQLENNFFSAINKKNNNFFSDIFNNMNSLNTNVTII